jgi:hypothetical protein
VLKEFEILIFLKFGLFLSEKTRNFLQQENSLFLGCYQNSLSNVILFSQFWQNLTPKKKKENK